VVIPELQKEESIWDLLPDNNKIIPHNLGSDNILDRVRNLLISNSTGTTNLTGGYMGDINTDFRTDAYKTYSTYGTYGDDFEKYLREYMYTSDESIDLP
jgi:hypothetical protein